MELPLQLRPIRFPLKLKLISLFTLVLLGSLAAYSHYALTRFIEDKSAYIYSTIRESAHDQGRDIEQVINEGKRTLAVLAALSDGRSSKQVFDNFPAFLDYREFDFKQGDFTLGIADPSGLAKYELEQKDIATQAKTLIEQGKLLPLKQVSLSYPFAKPVIVLMQKTEDKLQIAHLSLGEVLNTRSDAIEFALFSPEGKALLPLDVENQKRLWNYINGNFLLKNISQGVGEVNLAGISTLIGVHSGQNRFPTSIAIIDRSHAFSVAEELIEKSYLFAIFLLSLAIIIGVLFSRTLTRSLEILFNGTQQFVSGDFGSRVQVKSKDEIGALSDSFNYMGAKIVAYMEEMKEKIRLEREVEVAKLVQDSFFPSPQGHIPGGEFAAFYAPTSECGGDWWGHLSFNNKSALFIADATGHGVPAALITATANCGLHTLGELIKKHPTLIDHPAQMLEWFNKAISSAGKQLYMTMVCVVIDPQTKTLTWSNAAHHPILLLPGAIENPSRQDLIPLLSPPSPHLGKQIDSSFEQESRQYHDGDTLIFFTDGILENTNTEDKPYGERRFHQSIVEFKHKNLSLWRDSIARNALEHSGGTPNLDDVTLMLFSLGTTQQQQKIEYVSDDTVISHYEADDALDFLHAHQNVNHLVGANSPRLEEELEHIPPTPGEHHFSWNGTSLEEFRQNFNQFLEVQTFTGWFESPKDYLRLIGDELVTNALTRMNIHVEVKLSLNHEGIVVEVTDNRGALKKDVLLDALKRARDTHAPRTTQTAGAGIGLYLVFQSTNQIWLNVTPNKKTQVICVFRKATKRYKNFRGRLTSFHFQEIS